MVQRRHINPIMVDVVPRGGAKEKEKQGKEASFYIFAVKAVWRIRDVYPGSRILIFTHPGSQIPNPGSRIPDPGSRIPDPKTATKERGEKKLVVIPFYVATNFTKLNIILVLKCRRKKFGPIFKEL
jgi:hypothetical protein